MKPPLSSSQRTQRPIAAPAIRPRWIVMIGCFWLMAHLIGSGDCGVVIEAGLMGDRDAELVGDDGGGVAVVVDGGADRKAIIGCNYDRSLCREDEACIQDGLFGRCQVMPYDPYQYHPSMSQLTALTGTLESLVDRGLHWHDPVTQCTLFYYYLSVRFGWTWDPKLCTRYSPGELFSVLQDAESKVLSSAEPSTETGITEYLEDVKPMTLSEVAAPSSSSDDSSGQSGIVISDRDLEDFFDALRLNQQAAGDGDPLDAGVGDDSIVLDPVLALDEPAVSKRDAEPEIGISSLSGDYGDISLSDYGGGDLNVDSTQLPPPPIVVVTADAADEEAFSPTLPSSDAIFGIEEPMIESSLVRPDRTIVIEEEVPISNYLDEAPSVSLDKRIVSAGGDDGIDFPDGSYTSDMMDAVGEPEVGDRVQYGAADIDDPSETPSIVAVDEGKLLDALLDRYESRGEALAEPESEVPVDEPEIDLVVTEPLDQSTEADGSYDTDTDRALAKRDAGSVEAEYPDNDLGLILTGPESATEDEGKALNVLLDSYLAEDAVLPESKSDRPAEVVLLEKSVPPEPAAVMPLPEEDYPLGTLSVPEKRGGEGDNELGDSDGASNIAVIGEGELLNVLLDRYDEDKMTAAEPDAEAPAVALLVEEPQVEPVLLEPLPEENYLAYDSSRGAEDGGTIDLDRRSVLDYPGNEAMSSMVDSSIGEEEPASDPLVIVPISDEDLATYLAQIPVAEGIEDQIVAPTQSGDPGLDSGDAVLLQPEVDDDDVVFRDMRGQGISNENGEIVIPSIDLDLELRSLAANGAVPFKKDYERLGILDQGTNNIPHRFATRKPLHPVTAIPVYETNLADGRAAYVVDYLSDHGTSEQMSKKNSELSGGAVNSKRVLDPESPGILSSRARDIRAGSSVAKQSSVDADDDFVVPTLVVCGVVGGTLIVLLGLYVVQVRSRTRNELKQLATDIESTPGKDYQDLCRQHRMGAKPEKPEPLTGFIGAITHRLGSQSDQSPPQSKSSSTSSWTEEPVMSNMDIGTGHMILSYMEDHLKNGQKIKQEWKALEAYQPEFMSTTMEGQKIENEHKNRDEKILPYDHSRVHLNRKANKDGSDYMNASYITDSDPHNPTYIACQGPLNATAADMWQMIWEQGAVVIVNLAKQTADHDGPHSRCHRYWPENGSEMYNGFEVHLVSEHIWCEDYLVRSFYLKNVSTNETRTLTQFHLLTWPDHGIPAATKPLLEFRRKVNKCYRGRSCPIVVHCSDGGGRTGTYCLLDMVLNRINKGLKEIDIAATLEHLRDQRMGMVETKEQFEFVLACVADEVHAILKALAAEQN